ncbi:hypothetical protein [Actinoplanes sp. NPDC051494]|uniref:recombination directionality factor n=1 Tax=Actinoplanes sp. NPDC051494 TaxID=3363907 RepID=UPI0037BD9739
MSISPKVLQQRLTLVGAIRLGQKVPTSNGNMRPGKLETLRFTSPSRQIVDAIADLYGGQVKPWQANTGPQWEVVSTVKEVAVLVPPQRIDPNLEHWGNGYRDRMCDGEVERIRNAACLCEQMQANGRRVDARELCKPTTRMALMLAKVPGMGVFKLESHGWNSAAELPTLAASIESAPQPIPARLEVQVREKKTFDPAARDGKQVESRVFMVPVLHFDWITPAQAFGGELGAASRAALGAATTERHAIEAAKNEAQRPKLPLAVYLAAVEDAATVQDVRDLWTAAAQDGALTDEVKAALNAKVAKLPQPQDKPAAPARATPQPPVDVVVDAEIVKDLNALWTEAQAAAGERGWSSDDLEQRIREHLNKVSDDVTEPELTRFLTAVKAGEVT